ncbi:hypothetical protein TCAL_10708 [Tigriopus californicus]|uniref:ABC-type glutathione-S-conjugate transporter n=1 Tax=Tigriopus californicus TaxID=6832 RepID=A0A553N969_TIGCA|nr:multidrug resistance-associated protein 1-like [Tigriopus californicus]TRY61972.1 hypothetical protein TCAL_10708 [Tigriopus californicus]|eukprot:TCALIF_10708-PA protein Name:"Similar to Abcc1 Multidrug resistance-associated protein 1 (Rattus norvegicus)" AED:0.02 eAED:0.02 QI:0/1/0.2/1/1/1/5/0/1514
MNESVSFCDDPLWDVNLTWYTTQPDFTTCFHQTILLYIPTIFLALFSPLELYFRIWKGSNKPVPWTLLNIAKSIFTGVLIVLPVVDLGYAISEDARTVHVVAAIVKIVTYAWALILAVACQRRGVVTSGVLVIFWFVATVCGAITFASVLSTPYLRGDDFMLPFLSYTLQFPLILVLFFLNCWADAPSKYKKLEEDVPNLTPEKHASFFSRAIFAWFDPFAWKGWRRTLEYGDLWDLKKSERCSGIVPEWDRHWEKNVIKSIQNSKSPSQLSITSTLVRSFGPAYAISALYQFGTSVLQFASPQIVNLIIDFVESDQPVWKGYLYTGLICLSTLFNTILNNQCFYQEYTVGLRIKTALISAVYRKSVKLSNSGRKVMTVGETTNLMSIDTQKFMDLTLYLNMIWASPLQIALAMYFLWDILGPSSLAGLAVMVLMIPLNAVVAQQMKRYQHAQMKDKDRRTRLMDEILNGIKVLKLYAWEPSFEKHVVDIRAREISALKKSAYLNSFTTFLWTCAPVLVALASFATYVLSDSANILDANTAFVSLTLFNLLRVPLNMLPMLLVFLVQCEVSLTRINTFMNSDELRATAVERDPNAKGGIVVKKANFAWDKEAEPVLRDINLTVKEGELVAVVGTVGAGKSSLLSAFLGEMERLSGSVKTNGKVAYVPQQAWMKNASLKDNVLFSKSFKPNLYDRVLDSCALVTDLEMLPGGDQTEIGEKGINLSGGQKQRVSIARAVYSNRDLYLLDDPLSAVDSHVGKHIFEHVIGPNGLLKKKTRVLVTHGVSFLPQVDNILVMKDGRISERGTYEELLSKQGDFASFLIQYLSEEGDKEKDLEEESELEDLKQELEKTLGKEAVQRQMMASKSVLTSLTDLVSDSSEKGLFNQRGKKRSSLMSTSRVHPYSSNSNIPPSERGLDEIKVGQNLIEKEKAEIGGVKWSVYRYYATSIGKNWSIVTILFYIIYQGFQLGANVWLSEWSTDPRASTDTSVRNLYLSVYGVLGLFQSLAIMTGTCFVMIGTLNAAAKLHSTMLHRILRSPMSFFDTTPLGRILNRFSKDIDIIDVTIPMNIRMLLNQSFNVLGTLVVICFANPIFIAVVIPIILMYYFLQKFYVTTARQVKRMESITRSPIYSHFGETISGAPTIRAYEMVQDFIAEDEKKIDFNQKCYYPTYVSSRWLSVRLELIGNLVILFASLFAVLFRDTMDPGKVGLSLSYALNITGPMNMLVRMTSEVETNMVSVERISEYQDTPQEAPLEIPEQDPPPEWPQYGVVKFDNYQTRYRDGLDLVLKGISVQIESGEKIGIVGRTGAGKSSLTLALFRIIESAGGSIYIDNENIGLLGLSKLRSRLTIIPQDPVLFSGSMRMNLDPFEQYSDRDIWRALSHAHLKSYVSNLPGGLNFDVNEGGENLSVGQRQLVCLARALLRKTKLLVLDEATAAVDLETDDLIQSTIRAEFYDCTVLTIAHRLNTIMDSSKVLVLDAGQIKEFDTPANLLARRSSIFYSMASDAGLTNNLE